MSSNVTFFLTSCKRHDLLKICLESFEQYNDYPIEHGIIIEDSGQDLSWCRDILKSIPNLELINTGSRQGQIRNIDRCYAMITTPYVFHCEDDFQFIKGGFISPSIKILEAEPSCINVWLTPYDRSWEDPASTHYTVLDYNRKLINQTQFQIDDVTYWNINNPVIGEWGLGFTFQPSVHRIANWQQVGGYENLLKTHAPWANLFDGGQTERNIARYYVEQNYHTRMLAGPNDNEEGYVISTGHTRHVPLPQAGELE